MIKVKDCHHHSDRHLCQGSEVTHLKSYNSDVTKLMLKPILWQQLPTYSHFTFLQPIVAVYGKFSLGPAHTYSKFSEIME